VRPAIDRELPEGTWRAFPNPRKDSSLWRRIPRSVKRHSTPLANFGAESKPAVPALIKAFKDKDPNIRWLAANTLGEIGPDAKPALPARSEASKDRNENVRHYAQEAIRPIQGQGGGRLPVPSSPLK
jgi:HEAT repeat protein